MKHFYRRFLFLACMVSSLFWGCDEESSVTSNVHGYSASYNCAASFGIMDTLWSEYLSDRLYLTETICMRAQTYLGRYKYDATCKSIRYNSSMDCYDITIVEDSVEKVIWAKVDGCRYKLGTEKPYSSVLTGTGYWNLDGCLCKVENGIVYYRKLESWSDPYGKSSSSAKSSSSSAVGSSSSAKSSSSSSRDVLESSSSAKVSSSSKELTYDDFVNVGGQIWMKKNLDVDVEGSMCYDDDPANCEKYGRLYTWAQAMGIDEKYDRERLGDIELPHRGICPEGMHIPSDEEWESLYWLIGERPEYREYFVNQIGGAYDWKSFYRSEDVEVVFWSSTEYDATGTGYEFEYAWIWAYRKDGSIDSSNPHKYMGAYVRCVEDF